MKALKFLFVLLALTLSFTSCSKDDDGDDSEFDGSIDAIENFYTPELLDALNDLGFVINTGNNPPIMDGTYLTNPNLLENSNIPNDNIGSTYVDLQLKFFNQNNQNLTLEFEGLENTTVIESVQSFISGSGDDFSVFLKVESTRGGHTCIVAYAFTGTLTEEGLINYQNALVMLDDKGDPLNDLIENNTGRLFIDGDGLCTDITPDSRIFISNDDVKPNALMSSGN
jgi:hypothetical protein